MSLALGPLASAPETARLHLLPFHIAHDGHAPISTFFRPQPAVAESFPGQDGAPASATEDAPDEGMPIETELSDKLAAVSVDPAVSNDSGRVVAAFRGRGMQGVRVALPEGYIGCVLRPPPSATPVAQGSGSSTSTEKAIPRAKKGAAVAKARAKRATRRAKLAGVVAEPEPEPEPEHEEDIETVAETPVEESAEGASAIADAKEEDVTATRVLRPSATFDSFMLWGADIAPDIGRDEYMRTLNEWVGIAAEVRLLVSGSSVAARSSICSGS
jgi:hypothetical protein